MVNSWNVSAYHVAEMKVPPESANQVLPRLEGIIYRLPEDPLLVFLIIMRSDSGKA